MRSIYSRLCGQLIVLLAVLSCSDLTGTVSAATRPEEDHSMVVASPYEAYLSPTGARLRVKETVSAHRVGGFSQVEFVLPQDTSNLQLDVPGHTIARWSVRPAVLKNSSVLAENRQKLEAEISTLAARVATLKARIAVFSAPSTEGNPQNLQQQQSMMQETMPGLLREQEQSTERLRLLREELSRLPGNPDMGEIVTVILANELPENQKVEIAYSYNYPGCGWNAIYQFNAQPDQGSGDLIQVNLLAEIWQYTGVDWKNVDVTLANRGSGPREPAPLPRWIIKAAEPQPEPKPVEKPAPRAVHQAMKLSATAKDAAAGINEAALSAPRVASIAASTENVYATWSLSQKFMPDGITRLQISQDSWKAPLQWLARPSEGDSRVWLFAQYDMPEGKAWPAGQAEFSVNDQSVGQGMFRPAGGQATLYFGADPLMSVRTSFDSQRHGEIGIINASKTWTWAWTYTLHNGHGKLVKVKVERPAPMIVEERVTVSYDNKPEGKIDDNKHMIYWDVDVPAHGKSEIHHSIMITSPVSMPLLPDVP